MEWKSSLVGQTYGEDRESSMHKLVGRLKDKCSKIILIHHKHKTIRSKYDIKNSNHQWRRVQMWSM